MSRTLNAAIAVIGIDIGKNSFHVVGLDARGAIVLRQRWSRSQVERRFANMPPCLVGMEACVGAHHLSRKLHGLGHDARPMPAKYVRPPTRRRADHLKRDGGSDPFWRCILQGRTSPHGGLVPRQMSTGDRTILGRISKRGNRYLRVLFVQAA